MGAQKLAGIAADLEYMSMSINQDDPRSQKFYMKIKEIVSTLDALMDETEQSFEAIDLKKYADTSSNESSLVS